MKLTIDKTQRIWASSKTSPTRKAIRNTELRDLVYDAWAMSLSSSGFDRINDMPCSGGPGGPELRGSGQAAHLNGVARIGVSIAQGLRDEVGHFPGRPGRGDRRRTVPRSRQGLGVRPRQHRQIERPSHHRLAVAAPPAVRRLRRPDGRPAGADRPHRRHPLGGGTAHHPQPRRRDRIHSRRDVLAGPGQWRTARRLAPAIHSSLLTSHYPLSPCWRRAAVSAYTAEHPTGEVKEWSSYPLSYRESTTATGPT